MPMAVVDRMGSSLYATGSPAAQALARYPPPGTSPPPLPDRKPPAWVFSTASNRRCPRPRCARCAGERERELPSNRKTGMAGNETGEIAIFNETPLRRRERGNELKGTEPLTPIALSRASARRAPGPVSKAS